LNDKAIVNSNVDIVNRVRGEYMDFPIIYGFNQCSEMGDNIFAPSVFVGGCNLRCPYCMNSKLITGDKVKQVEWNDIRDYVSRNKIEWITISGGEPTCINPKLLMNLINSFIGMGCKVGLSTNGTNTENLSRIISGLNYVALDIKSSRYYVYEEISCNHQLGKYNSFNNIILTRASLSSNKFYREDFDYEIRTTLYPEYINKDTLEEIGHMFIVSDCKWVLQQFRNTDDMFSDTAYSVKPYTDEEAKDFLNIAKDFTSKAQLRYV